MSTAFTLHDVSFGYDDRQPALHRLTGTLGRGSMTAVVGPNGSGKSTLLKGLIGFLTPLQGRLTRGGLRPRDMAYLPQRSGIDRSFPVTVFETVLLGHWCKIGLYRPVTSALRREAREALNAVGLEGIGERPISSLSAGQFQRMLFARLLVQDCPVLLLDEPFSAVDSRTTSDLLDLIGRWHEEGRTVITVLHDLDQVREHFPQTLLIAREPVAWGASVDVLQAEHLAQARQMADAWDAPAGPYARDGEWQSTLR